jgi:hypothetical protein
MIALKKAPKSRGIFNAIRDEDDDYIEKDTEIEGYFLCN